MHDEGERWVKQAEVNFISLEVLFNDAKTHPRICGIICFMAHQVAEVALKGGMYYVCGGLDQRYLRSHNICPLVHILQSERPGETHGLVNHVTSLENYYLTPRFPNLWEDGIVPADMYFYEQAKQAKDNAEAILRNIQRISQNISMQAPKKVSCTYKH